MHKSLKIAKLKYIWKNENGCGGSKKEKIIIIFELLMQQLCKQSVQFKKRAQAINNLLYAEYYYNI